MSEPYNRYESYRLYSFLHYPDDAVCRPSQLVRMGFYSTGQGEAVMCSGCGVGHTSFQPRQSIRRAHVQMSPNCPLNNIGDGLQADDASAAPYFVPQAPPDPYPNQDLPPMDNDLIRCYSHQQQRNIVLDRTNPTELGYRWLSKEDYRLRWRTFYDWSVQNGEWDQQTLLQLALHGLFYTGTRDEVRCCVCGTTYRASLLRDQPDARTESCPLSSCKTYFF